LFTNLINHALFIWWRCHNIEGFNGNCRKMCNYNVIHKRRQQVALGQARAYRYVWLKRIGWKFWFYKNIRMLFFQGIKLTKLQLRFSQPHKAFNKGWKKITHTRGKIPKFFLTIVKYVFIFTRSSYNHHGYKNIYFSPIETN
jgi:hypothetical protein